MKKAILSLAALGCIGSAGAQALVSSWILNTNGKVASYWANNGGMPPSYTFTTSTDSADALKVCYDAINVYVRSNSMTNDMGKYLNPGSPVAQHFTHRFPRNPTVPTAKTVSPKVAEIGLLTNGIAIYGLTNAASWTGTTNSNPQQGGQGIWNVEVGKSEGFVLDTAFGAHPQQQGVYHTHTTPYRLYKYTPVSQHSPIVGWAFDGYPVYGPYGYSTPMDATSATTRMKTGYSLRNITTRTTLPAIPGNGATTSQAGPPVNGTYPIGTYVEDYEWVAANGGDLDQHNGRLCVTPEFPQGTYAYFVTMDAAGAPAFPYYIGVYYYGQPDAANIPAGPNGNGLSIPSTVTTCRSAASNGVGGGTAIAPLRIHPNPAANGSFVISGNGHGFNYVTVVNLKGQKVYGAALKSHEDHAIRLSTPGIYLVRCENPATGTAVVERVVVR